MFNLKVYVMLSKMLFSSWIVTIVVYKHIRTVKKQRHLIFQYVKVSHVRLQTCTLLFPEFPSVRWKFYFHGKLSVRTNPFRNRCRQCRKRCIGQQFREIPRYPFACQVDWSWENILLNHWFVISFQSRPEVYDFYA